MQSLIRILVVASALLVAGCVTPTYTPYLALLFEDARVVINVSDTRNFDGVRFARATNQPEVDRRQARIHGAGTILIGKSRIQYDDATVVVNGKKLQGYKEGGYHNYILYPDGQVEEGFIRSFR